MSVRPTETSGDPAATAASAHLPVGTGTQAARPARLTSLDAYRGLAMLLMASEGLGLLQVAAKHPDNWFWKGLAYEIEHVTWVGCSLWDLIQPSFMFMVGVAMPFSHESRLARGDSRARIAVHVLWRSLALILLGIFLRSERSTQTYFTFEDVLTQIGLGYAFVYLLIGRGLRAQLATVVAILVGTWCLFNFYPAPSDGFDYKSVGLPDDLVPFTGFLAHWNQNTNVAAAFDRWFLNLFPRSSRFVNNYGGYQTLSFIPSMATMLLGLMAGELLRRPIDTRAKLKRLLVAGAVCFAIGLALDWEMWPLHPRTWALCPVVKRIWTPSWVVFAAGWTFTILATFYWLIDMRGRRRWAFPLIVVGMNSIAMYVMAHLTMGWVEKMLKIHLGKPMLGVDLFGGQYGPVFLHATSLFALWLVCLWMYRRRIFLKI